MHYRWHLLLFGQPRQELLFAFAVRSSVAATCKTRAVSPAALSSAFGAEICAQALRAQLLVLKLPAEHARLYGAPPKRSGTLQCHMH